MRTILQSISAAWIVCLLSGVNCRANVYLPTTLADPVITSLNNANGQINGGTTVSLRSALKAADNLSGTHTVTLSNGTYSLTQTSPERQITIGNTSQNITINGNGPANTIISMTNDAGKDRILFINPTGGTNSPVITVQGIKFQNGYLSSDPYGGAAICAGGGAAESLTVTNCVFDNNILPAGAYGGAAVCMQVRGNLTISNSTFTNNVSNDADGGAVFFTIFGTSLGTAYGSCSVTNSIFSGNAVHIPGATGSNGGALAVTAQGGSAPFSATITGNTFLNNTADGYGGAISANNSAASATFNINYNRFAGNAILGDPSFPGDSAPTNAMLFVHSAGSVNANNNWWASNNGPGATGMQRASGVGTPGAGVFTANRWLQLKTTAGTNPIVTNQSSSLTASFLSNNLNDAISSSNLTTLIGLPVAWSGAGGTVTGQQTTVQAAGTATATYNETTGVAGAHNATAVVDSGPASGSVNTIAFTVNKANATTVINSDTPDPTVTGQGVAVAYSVTGSSGNSPTVPSGNVQVSDGVNSNTGTAAAGSATVALFTAGNRTLTATYQGDANFNASPASAGAAHLVNKADTTATIISDNPDPSVVGQQITVTYSVAANAPGTGTMTGNVLVSDGVNSATGTVAAGSVNLTLKTAGNRTLTATYQGDTNYNASPASAGTPHAVNLSPAFTNGPPPSPVAVGTPYNFSYTASGFPAPAFSVTAGSLPTNLVLSGAGVISGTPTVAGTFTGTVTAANGAAPNATQAFSIKINGPPTVTNVAKSANEDVPTAFAAADFTPGSYSDPNNDPLATVRITSPPTNGLLKISGITFTVPQDIAIVNIGNLTYTSNLNYNGPDSFGWNGSDGTLFATTGATFNVTVNSVNDNPTAGPDTIFRYPTQSVKVSIATLLSNDSDIDGGTLAFVSVNTPSPNGGTVTSDGTTVFYAPALNFTGADTFTYNINDGQGGTATGTVTIALIVDNAASQNITNIETLGDGSKRLSFAGIPGRTYRVQSSDTLSTGPWSDRGSFPADAQGRFQFTDAVPLPPTRFYRSVQP